MLRELSRRVTLEPIPIPGLIPLVITRPPKTVMDTFMSDPFPGWVTDVPRTTLAGA